MEFISSDTNVWLDFSKINALDLPFRLPYIYLMNEDAVSNEMLSPPDLSDKLTRLGLKSIEWTLEDFNLASTFKRQYRKLSKYDCVALAIAKNRNIVLLTGDKALRKAAVIEGVEVIGTIGILDELYLGRFIERDTYRNCLLQLLDLNGKGIRLPESELIARLESISEDD